MEKNNLSIIILAAGRGTRMKSDLPKVLHKISGKEMLYYSIMEAKKLSDDITVVLYYKAGLIKKIMGEYFDDINYVIQDHLEYPGTGGAVMNIEPKNDKVLVLNGDMPLIQSEELLKLTLNNSPITMSILELDNPSGYGRVIINNNKVKKIVEEKDCRDDQLEINKVNAGIYCFDKKFLLENLPKLSSKNAQEEYYITDLVELAVSSNLEVSPIVVSEENFKGVNSKIDLAQALDIHQDRIKKEFMKNGVTMIMPSTIYIEYDVEIEGESILENGVTLLGESKIINSHIKTNSIVEDSIIEDSNIGPMARIRPKSNILETHIGNFVEIKKSNLTGVKAGHLAYLGDSSIDEGTNIGAGVITCNYDGVNKHKTVIGKNVFIGSDTQLVAPVILEDDCMVGAGTTVTKNVKRGELIITRAKAKIMKDYFYKVFK
ncbi:MAG: bifunctional UDP-N-acetylglucosamine diphosphorylase/glucosamine-1-phosphate N-acetyltransferase GlmU [Campylobacterota bacterium]|nr:bifunctional UDP-N-acetylglucosamine diphosphorylase/glucosamine-1-phosphate N-acetyltransferase GlmU [Campylobacterota bacterium]